jgi:hypothetical protein
VQSPERTRRARLRVGCLELRQLHPGDEGAWGDPDRLGGFLNIPLDEKGRDRLLHLAIELRAVPFQRAGLPAQEYQVFALKPANIAGAIYPANRSAEGPIEAGRGPSLQPVGIDQCRDSPAVGREVDLCLLPVVKRWIVTPGLFEGCLFDNRAELCHEPLHRNHLIDRCEQGRSAKRRASLRASVQTIAVLIKWDCYTSVFSRTQRRRTFAPLPARSVKIPGGMREGNHDKSIVHIHRSRR